MADGVQLESARGSLTGHRLPTSALRPPAFHLPAQSKSPRASGQPPIRGAGSQDGRGQVGGGQIKNQKSKILSPHLPSSISHLRENAPAFSLVELLAVVGIVGILSVAAVPLLRGLGDAQSSRGTAMVLVSALEQARTAAIVSGTEVYLALPDRNFPLPDYRSNSYVILRRKVTNSGGPNDDFFTNQTADWIVLSKWERLPGTLVFSLSNLTNNRLTVSSLAIPGNPNWQNGQLTQISFNPSGALNADSPLRIFFAPSNVVSNRTARFADFIEITRFSGRVRYAGLTNNLTNF